MNDIRNAILLIISLSMPVTSYSNYDAKNDGEAVGMMLMLIRKIQLYQFMCEKYHSELAGEHLNAIQTWEEKNSKVLSNYYIKVNTADKKELDEIAEIDRKVNAKKISIFNQLTYDKQRDLCKNNISDLMKNREKENTPMMFKYLGD